MTEKPDKKKAPIPVPDYNKADIYALQAVRNGTASPEQQMRALDWIITKACDTYGFCDKPDNDRLCAIFDGRRFAGTQIVKLINANIISENKDKLKPEELKNARVI